MTTVDTLRFYNANLARTQATIAKAPTVKRQTDYFNKNIGTIKTSKDFVNNYQVFSYAMTAHGLSDMVYAKAFIQKILDGGLSSSSSLANKLTDPRFKALVAAYNFGDKGASATSSPSNNAQTVSAFVEQTLENKAGEADQGAQIALYFQRKASTITTGYQILGDKALSQFVQTAFQLPTVTSVNALDVVAKTIEQKIKMSDLKDPAKVQKLVTRFAAAWDAQHNTALSNSALQLFANASTGMNGLSSSLLTKIQSAYTRF